MDSSRLIMHWTFFCWAEVSGIHTPTQTASLTLLLERECFRRSGIATVKFSPPFSGREEVVEFAIELLSEEPRVDMYMHVNLESRSSTYSQPRTQLSGFKFLSNRE
ncbi:hypothetical protein FB45DRAFT_868629 [Roridomyces roridus]|uniref:Uncharacterized protein n=1 Tax=Roridomyces roridus TaxID=1738132 RepID=A0AAD7BQ94_9AGAR|nr:hypothetical protein FB45DRAFT_868629 [Roridomyces roridus]